MNTYRVVDEDGDWYEVEGDPAEALAAVTMQADHAIGLLIELTSTVPCDYDRGDCMTHGFDLSGGGKCPHDLARAFLAAARPRRTEATEEV